MKNAHGTKLAADRRVAPRPTFTNARLMFLMLVFPFTVSFVWTAISLTNGDGEALLMWARDLIDTITPW